MAWNCSATTHIPTAFGYQGNMIRLETHYGYVEKCILCGAEFMCIDPELYENRINNVECDQKGDVVARIAGYTRTFSRS